jgi:hypothetical protein
VDARVYLDEFRPFRRGELALARREVDDPLFLNPGDRDRLRYVLRLAQLSSLGAAPDGLVDLIGSQRLRMLQLLAPVLPTDPSRIDAAKLTARLPKVIDLAGQARTRILASGLCAEAQLDAEVTTKRLALVLGGAAGSGYVFLGALRRLEVMGIVPSYVTGCSVGAILAVVRGRRLRFDLEELYEDVRRMREGGVFRVPDPRPRFGLPAALRLDLRGALGDLFTGASGDQMRLADLAIPVDVLATGLAPGALTEDRETYAHLIDSEIHSAAAIARLPARRLARVVGPLVSLAMSRQVLVPLFLGADPETRELAALDAAGFSAAIPGLLHYDVPADAVEGFAILERLFERHGLAGVVDGALASLIPARYTWDAIEAGRIGSRNTVILALDAVASPRGTNALLAPILRVISATADRDRAFWDLHVNFRRAPGFLDLFPTEQRLRRAADDGAREFEETARVLRPLLAPLPRWQELVN